MKYKVGYEEFRAILLLLSRSALHMILAYRFGDTAQLINSLHLVVS